MGKEISKKPSHKTRISWPKRALYCVLALLAVLVIALMAIRVFITTSSGARFIERQVNQRSFGPIDNIQISGLSGDPLSDFTLGRLVIADTDGEWLRAENVNLKWKPFAYFKNHIWIENLSIKSANISRRPDLNFNSDAPKKAQKPLKVTIKTYGLNRINLSKGVVNQPVSFDSFGQLLIETNGAITANIKANRLDVSGDTFNFDLTRKPNGTLRGEFVIDGIADGPIAQLLKAPVSAAVSGIGSITGTAETGEGKLALIFGSDEILNAQTQWTAAELTVSADFNTQKFDIDNLDAIQAGIGTQLKSSLNVNRQASPKTFTAKLNASSLSLIANGVLPDEGYRPEHLALEITADNISNFDALPEGYSAAKAGVKGTARIAAPYSFDGAIEIEDIKSPFILAKTLTGPIKIAQGSSQTNLYDLSTNLRFNDVKALEALPIKLASEVLVTADGKYNTASKRLDFQKLDLTSGQSNISITGELTPDTQYLDIKGRGQTILKPVGETVATGLLAADFRLLKTPETPIAFSTDGVFRPDAPYPALLGQLIGERLIFKVDISSQKQSQIMAVKTASLIGDNFKASISGELGQDLAIAGEALINSAVNIQNLAINSGAQASFTLTGPRSSPALRLDAKAEAIRAQDYIFEAPRLRMEITDLVTAPKGPIQFNAQTEQGPLSFGAKFASNAGEYITNDIRLDWDGLTASGALTLPQDKIAIGQFDLNIADKSLNNESFNNDNQYARAKLILSNSNGEQAITFDADAKNISFAGIKLNTLSAQTDGTLAALTGKINAAGQNGSDLISREFLIDLPFSVNKTREDIYTATAMPELQYGNIALTARTPITVTHADNKTSLTAPLTVAGGNVDVNYEKTDNSEALKLTAAALPITLIPMASALADTSGTMTANIDLSIEDNGPLKGDAVMKILDWRGFDISEGGGLNVETRVEINNTSALTSLTVNSPEGFNGQGQIDIPLLAAPSIGAVRLALGAPIKGEVSASGAAAAILGLITPSDAELGGDISLDVSVTGTLNAPLLKGQMGGQDISFEAPELGTRIRNGRFGASFTNDTLSLRDVYITDTNEGSLAGGGEFKLGPFGRPLGDLKIQATDFTAIDRKDMSAKVDGTIDIISQEKGAKITGDVTIKNTEVKQFVSSNVGVIEIEVEEIGLTKNIKKPSTKRPPTRIDLDIRVRAPRRIFIRSRGLDVEMSVNATLKGTSAEPLIYGEAKVLRGGFKIAGKTLDFEDGTIKFDGEIAKVRVDFNAVTETQNLEARVSITGTVDKPEITLSSQPERPEDEILSALLFGRSVTELSGIEAAQLAGALAQLSGRGGGLDLLGGIRDTLGISQLSVSFSEDNEAQLVGGRYLAKNVYLEVFSGAGPDQTGAIIDWEIRKNLSLSSRVRADNDQALSLKWKRDF